MALFEQHTLETEGRFANDADFQRAGLFKRGGIYIGQTASLLPRKLYYNGAGSIIVVGKQEVGKTTSLIIPNLLTYDRGSLVVTDPKGVLLPQTMEHRRDVLGQEIVVLSPWADELKAGLGYDIPDTGFNPLSVLRMNDPALRDNADMIAGILCPIPPTTNENSKFFKDSARAILTGLMLLLVARKTANGQGAATLGELYVMAHCTYDEWEEHAREMERAQELYGISLREYARKILSPMKADRQFAGIEGEIANALSIYDPNQPLARHVAKNGFNPDDLKRRKITVYVVCPQNRRAKNKDWLALVMAMCAESICRPGKAAPVLLMMEEFANLGYMEIARYIAEGREAGLQAHLTVQSESQLYQNYGQNGLKLFLDLCSIKQFLLIDDEPTAAGISRYIGKHNVSDNPAREVWQDVVRPDQLLKMKAREQIMLISGATPAALAWIKPYYKDRLWNWQAGENPMLTFPKGRKPFWIAARDKLHERLPPWVFKRPVYIALAVIAALIVATLPYPINASIAAAVGLGGLGWWLYWVRPDFAPWNSPVQDELEQPSNRIWSPWVVWLFWGFIILVIVDIWGN